MMEDVGFPHKPARGSEGPLPPSHFMRARRSGLWLLSPRWVHWTRRARPPAHDTMARGAWAWGGTRSGVEGASGLVKAPGRHGEVREALGFKGI